LHQGICIIGIIRVETDADAQCDEEFMALEMERPAQRRTQFLGDRSGILGLPDLGEQDHEFVASLTADGVDVAHAFLETFRNRLEQAVV
jgi:hypothetical protein